MSAPRVGLGDSRRGLSGGESTPQTDRIQSTRPSGRPDERQRPIRVDPPEVVLDAGWRGDPPAVSMVLREVDTTVRGADGRQQRLEHTATDCCECFRATRRISSSQPLKPTICDLPAVPGHSSPYDSFRAIEVSRNWRAGVSTGLSRQISTRMNARISNNTLLITSFLSKFPSSESVSDSNCWL